MDADPAAREAAVARLNLGLDRAIRGVEQLLLLAREEAGSAQASSASGPVDLQSVITLAVADVLPQARLKNMDLGLADSPTAQQLPTLQGQPQALRILLRNLLENAVKYTPPGGQVDVSLGVQQGQPVLRVEDSGPGIAPEHRPRVFDRFFASATRRKKPAADSGWRLPGPLPTATARGWCWATPERLGGLKVEVLCRAAAGLSFA